METKVPVAKQPMENRTKLCREIHFPEETLMRFRSGTCVPGASVSTQTASDGVKFQKNNPISVQIV